MPIHSPQTRMQQPDVDATRLRGRIGGSQVFGDRGSCKALPMDGHVPIFHPHGFRAIVAQNAHVLRQRQHTRHFVRGIVVAGDDENRDLLLPQSSKLLGEIEPRVVITAIAVIEVARNHDEIDPLLDGQVDQSLERPARRSPHPLYRSVFVTLEPLERAVEMNVGRVKKRDRHEGGTHSVLRLGLPNLIGGREVIRDRNRHVARGGPLGPAKQHGPEAVATNRDGVIPHDMPHHRGEDAPLAKRDDPDHRLVRAGAAFLLRGISRGQDLHVLCRPALTVIKLVLGVHPLGGHPTSDRVVRIPDDNLELVRRPVAGSGPSPL